MFKLKNLIEKRNVKNFFNIYDNKAISKCNTIEIQKTETDDFLERRYNKYENITYEREFSLDEFYENCYNLGKTIHLFRIKKHLIGIYRVKLFIILWIFGKKEIFVAIPNKEFPIRFSNRKFNAYVAPISHVFIKKVLKNYKLI